MEFVFTKIEIMEVLLSEGSDRVDMMKKSLEAKKPYIDAETIAIIFITCIKRVDFEMIKLVIEHQAFKNMYDDLENENLQVQLASVMIESYAYILRNYNEHWNFKHTQFDIKEIIYRTGYRYLGIA